MDSTLSRVVLGTIILLFGWFVWPTPYNYGETVFLGERLDARIHRITGETEVLLPTGWQNLNRSADGEATKSSQAGSEEFEVECPPEKFQAYEIVAADGENPTTRPIVEAALSCEPDAMYQLGMRYLRGDGPEVDRERGEFWLRGAAERGHDGAQSVIDSLRGR